MPKVLFLLADGFEEMEMVVPWDMLKRAEIEIKTASIHAHTGVRSVHGMVLSADCLLSEVKPGDYDMLVLPGGGPGTGNLRQSSAVRQHVLVAADQGKWIAAICAAPLVLSDAGILRNRRAVTYPSCAEDLLSGGAVLKEEPVVVDGKIITGQGPGAAAGFGHTLISALLGVEPADQIWHQMVFSLPAPSAMEAGSR